jgi:hypothetical protein
LRTTSSAPPTSITSAPAIKPIVTPVCDEDDEASATTRLGVDDGVAAGPLSDVDARGDGFTEDVGVGDTGTTVGLAVAVAVGFGLACVGVGVGVALCVGVGVEEGVVLVTRTDPVIEEWIEQ